LKENYIVKVKLNCKRGGSRPGAGRPQGAKGKNLIDPELKRNRLGIRLPAWMIGYIKEIAGDHKVSIGRVVETAMAAYLKSMGFK